MGKATKSVIILVRYQHKVTGTVYAKVRNGENKEYCVALHKSGNTTCTCLHGQEAGNHAHCYHVKHVQEMEKHRQEKMTVSYSTEEQRRNAPLNGNNKVFSLTR